MVTEGLCQIHPVLKVGRPNLSYTKQIKLLQSEKYKTLSLKLLQVKENVILSSINSNTRELNKPSIENILTGIMDNLSKSFGQQEVYLTFTKPNDPNLSVSRAGQIIISFYEAIFNSGKENAAQIIRYLYTQK